MDEITKRLHDEERKRQNREIFVNSMRGREPGLPDPRQNKNTLTDYSDSCEKRETLPHPGRLASAMTTAPVLSLIERLEQLEQRISCQHQEISNLDIRLGELENLVRG